jgi:simple sugar transport system ATP-binding protein
MGLLKPVHGSIELGGTDIAHWSTRERRDRGIGWIPADRHRNGLLLQAPLWENAMLGHQSRPPFARGPWIDRKGSRQRTEEIMREFDVRAPGPDVAAHALSGGNQQKLVVGREMTTSPSLLIASHPTRGIDVGAQAAVWEQLREARRSGLAVLLISADLEELIGLSDTLLVMLRGRIQAQLDPATVTPEELGTHMTGAGAAA